LQAIDLVSYVTPMYVRPSLLLPPLCVRFIMIRFVHPHLPTHPLRHVYGGGPGLTHLTHPTKGMQHKTMH